MFEWGGTGFYDVIGNVWQWTETPIDGLPGFEVHPLYDDFSTPTFGAYAPSAPLPPCPGV